MSSNEKLILKQAIRELRDERYQQERKGITYSRCYALLLELEDFGKHLTITAPSILDIEATKLMEERVGALNTIWDYVNELKNNCT